MFDFTSKMHVVLHKYCTSFTGWEKYSSCKETEGSSSSSCTQRKSCRGRTQNIHTASWRDRSLQPWKRNCVYLSHSFFHSFIFSIPHSLTHLSFQSSLRAGIFCWYVKEILTTSDIDIFPVFTNF